MLVECKRDNSIIIVAKRIRLLISIESEIDMKDPDSHAIDDEDKEKNRKIRK